MSVEDSHPMVNERTIIGIDPGTNILGFGVIHVDAHGPHYVDMGVFDLRKIRAPFEKLANIFAGIEEILATYSPDEMAVERLYFNTNTTTAIDVAQARGVIVLAAENSLLPVFEYTPLQVKQAITGYGRAEKRQVMEMVKNILALERVPKPDDTADALALAVCHAHCSGTTYSRLYRGAVK